MIDLNNFNILEDSLKEQAVTLLLCVDRPHIPTGLLWETGYILQHFNSPISIYSMSDFRLGCENYFTLYQP